MSRKIIGATVGTTISASAIKDQINPVMSVNGVGADENGNITLYRAEGAPGVYVGTDTPPDDANIWINPAGIPTGTEDWEFDLDDGNTAEKTVVVIGADEANGRLAVLRMKQADGTWVEIPAIRGSDGKDGASGRDGEQGRDGAPGSSGVYIGTGTPSADANIWINPNGEPTGTEVWEFDLDNGTTAEKSVVVVGSDDAEANGNLAILRMKDANGNWVEIPAIVGSDGVDGYTPQKGVDYFDGKDGKNGKDGKDGYTPQKGVDYFDGKDGKNGKDGVDGYTPQKGVDYFDGKDGKNGSDGYTPQKGKDYFDGTSVTVVSVSESSEDGGSNVVSFSGGKTLTVKNGKTGAPGANGKDYVLTDADKNGIAAAVKALLKTDTWTATYEDGTTETIEVYVK